MSFVHFHSAIRPDELCSFSLSNQARCMSFVHFHSGIRPGSACIAVKRLNILVVYAPMLCIPSFYIIRFPWHTLLCMKCHIGYLRANMRYSQLQIKTNGVNTSNVIFYNLYTTCPHEHSTHIVVVLLCVCHEPPI